MLENKSKFLERGVTLTVGPAPELVINEANIRSSLGKVIQREKSRGNKLDVWIDDNIWGWSDLQGEIMTAIEKEFNAIIYRFRQTITHAKVCKEAEKFSIKKDWKISEAWNIIIAGILAGEVDQNGNGIFAYFTVKVQGEDVSYRFNAYRNGDGNLHVYVREVCFVSGWNTDDGVVLDN